MYYCCSKWGYCGDTSEHCKCSECVDYRKHYSLNITSKLEGMHCHNWITRKNVFENYFISFLDYAPTKFSLSLEKEEPIDENQAYRNDGRCGSEFKAPNGEVAECNPVGEYFCCSKWGFCGMTEEHCNCPECIDYRKPDAKS